MLVFSHQDGVSHQDALGQVLRVSKPPHWGYMDHSAICEQPHWGYMDHSTICEQPHWGYLDHSTICEQPHWGYQITHLR
eukprot:gene10517-biopygen3210